MAYEDEEDIRALAPALLNQDYLRMNRYYETYETAPDGTVTSHLAEDVSVNVRIRRRGSYRSAAGEYSGEWTDGLACSIDLSKLSPETAAKYGLLP